ncbi:MAG: hypothetical protein FWF49_01415 [Oscillospiraceae bacterium]|nr:hypothetical protein [Oscillospiraceae bacterium]
MKSIKKSALCLALAAVFALAALAGCTAQPGSGAGDATTTGASTAAITSAATATDATTTTAPNITDILFADPTPDSAALAQYVFNPALLLYGVFDGLVGIQIQVDSTIMN